MNVLRYLLALLCFSSLVTTGQTQYPKDTIYVNYTPKEGNEKEQGSIYFRGKEVSGVFFYIKDSINRLDRGMPLLYDSRQKADTLSLTSLKKYSISTLRDINKKTCKGIMYREQPPADRNAFFTTFLIEVISEDYFVVYPVEWLGEGIFE